MASTSTLWFKQNQNNRGMKTEQIRTFCERCEKDCDEVFECEICGQMICENAKQLTINFLKLTTIVVSLVLNIITNID